MEPGLSAEGFTLLQSQDTGAERQCLLFTQQARKSPLIPASVSPNPAPGAGNLDWPRLGGAEKKKKQQILNVKVRRSVFCPER